MSPLREEAKKAFETEREAATYAALPQEVAEMRFLQVRADLH
jgi:hypothetical protein